MTEKISRNQARIEGLIRYNDGPMCKRGHQGERYTSTAACIECLPIRVPREYASWQHARGRTTDPDHPAWPEYGGRGIRMCQAWIDSFATFLIDMGPRPPNTQLERLDNDALDGYFPGNVVWATSHRQSRNKRTNVWINAGNGRGKVCMTDAARSIGVATSTIRTRTVRKQVTPQESFDHFRQHGICPVGLYRSHRIVLDGVICSLAEVGRRLGYDPRTIREISLRQHDGDLQATVDRLCEAAEAAD